MNSCTQGTLTGAAFAHLRGGISALGLWNCRADLVAAARGLSLPVKTRSSRYVALDFIFDELGEERVPA